MSAVWGPGAAHPVQDGLQVGLQGVALVDDLFVGFAVSGRGFVGLFLELLRQVDLAEGLGHGSRQAQSLDLQTGKGPFAYFHQIGETRAQHRHRGVDRIDRRAQAFADEGGPFAGATEKGRQVLDGGPQGRQHVLRDGQRHIADGAVEALQIALELVADGLRRFLGVVVQLLELVPQTPQLLPFRDQIEQGRRTLTADQGQALIHVEPGRGEGIDDVHQAAHGRVDVVGGQAQVGQGLPGSRALDAGQAGQHTAQGGAALGAFELGIGEHSEARRGGFEVLTGRPGQRARFRPRGSQSADVGFGGFGGFEQQVGLSHRVLGAATVRRQAADHDVRRRRQAEAFRLGQGEHRRQGGQGLLDALAGPHQNLGRLGGVGGRFWRSTRRAPTLSA